MVAEYVAPGLQLIAADIIKMAQEEPSFGIRFLPSSGSAKAQWSFIIGGFIALSWDEKKDRELPHSHRQLPHGHTSPLLTLIVILWFRARRQESSRSWLLSLFRLCHSILDAIKGKSPKELMEMTLAFRPTRGQVFEC